jgi:hypothetical protein
VIDKRDAENIAKKLGAKRRQGRKHEQVLVWHDEKLVARYGIRRGSGNPGHAHVAKELHISAPQARELADCPMSTERYFEILAEKGLLQ